MRPGGRAAVYALVVGGWLAAALTSVQTAAEQGPSADVQPAPKPSSDLKAVLDRYCLTCHNERLRTGGLTLQGLDPARAADHPETWEPVITKLRTRSMPPVGMPRPDGATYDRVASALEREIDLAWAARPRPGRVNAVHRLNRVEYRNAIRDIFGLDIDVTSQLPGDETADGSFDNFADVLTISTAHLERYLSVARQVTRLATGLPPVVPAAETFEVPLHVVQDDRQSEDLPFGSRGGLVVPYNFPVDGEYLVKVRLRRQYQDYIMGMGWPQQLDLRLDGALVKRFTVGGGAKGRPAAASYAGDGEPGFAGDPEWERYMQIEGDAGLELRLQVPAGPHQVGVSFVREYWEPEGLPQPLQRGRVITNDQIYMDYASVGSLHVAGPFRAAGAAEDTPSRRAIFVCRPQQASEEPACAERILSRIARLAYRRSTTPSDLETLIDFFDRGRGQGGSFDEGVQFALERVLMDPDFLLRVYRDPPSATRAEAATGAYALNDLEVASRLSFFLWSSVPDERLLDLAERGELTRPDVLEAEVRRMLAAPKAIDALVNSFAAQWLNLRRVHDVVVHPEIYPNYDESLLDAFEQETKMFLASTLREDRSVLDLLRADYTFVNERLARHYGIAGVYGSRLRRITLPDLEQRGGLLAHGSLLATTSYPDRTSPVLRGKWLLDNIFGMPAPPPPAGVDTTLVEPKPGSLPPTIRERLAQHRTSPVCAGCHSVIDPIGFALENFDAIGGWRTRDEAGSPVDATGSTVSGEAIEGLPGLRAALLRDPNRFASTVTEKLLAYALGRRLEYYDRPAVRQIVREASAGGYRWSALVLGIARSPTFLTRAVADRSN
jgi:hypothetical protein